MDALAPVSRWAPWLAAAAVLAVGFAAWPYTVDDAFVLARYASRLASGHGWTFVDGPATDGVTGPLGIVPGALGALVGLEPVSCSKLVGLGSAALATGLAVRRARRRAIGPLAGWTACAFAAASGTIGIWGAAGLETGLATLAATGLALAVTARPRRLGWAVVCAVAIPALRPELVPFAGVLALGLLRRDRSAGLRVVLALGASLAVLALGRALAFGSPLPMALAAKPGSLADGGRYVLSAAAFALGGLALVPAALGAQRSGRVRWVLGALAAHAAAVLVAGGDWMPGYRLFAPILPLQAWIVGVGVAELVRERRAGSRVALAALLLSVALPTLDLVAQLGPVRDAGAAREREGRALAAFLDAHATRVALVDVGFLAWVGHFEPVDLAGITDPEIARISRGHVDAPVTGAMLLDRGVDAIVLSSRSEPALDADGNLTALAGHPTERRLAVDPAVRASFRVAHRLRYSSSTWYVVLLGRGE